MFVHIEAAIWRCFVIGLVKNFANSQKSTCVRVSFLISLQASAYNFIKKKILPQVFSCEFSEIFNPENEFDPPFIFLEELIQFHYTLYNC